MKRWSFHLLTLGTWLATASGVAYFIMKHYMEPVSPFAVIHHPLEPWMLKAHILAGPVVVVALGAVLQGHFLPQRAEGGRHGRKTGTWVLVPATVMVASGYSLQVVTGEWIGSITAWVHLGTGLLFLGLLMAHRRATRGLNGKDLAGPALLALLVALLLLLGPHGAWAQSPAGGREVPTGEAGLQTARGLWPVMGTLLTAEVYTGRTTSPEAGNTALLAVRDAVFRADSLMSTYRADSDVSRLNRSAGAEAWVRIHPDTREVLDEALRIGRETGGLMDVTLGPLVRLWRFDEAPTGESLPVPPDEQIQGARARTGQNRIDLSEEGSAARLLLAGMRVDLGGIAKGWALDRAAEAAAAAGAARGILDLGGQIRVFGEAPGPEGWRIAVRDPRGGSRVAAWFDIQAGSVATSGDYERYFVHEGRRYAHILDPRSGRPVSGVLSVTVWAPTGVDADGWSTALFVAGPEEGRRLLKDRPDLGALWVLPPDENEDAGLRMVAAGHLEGRLVLSPPSLGRLLRLGDAHSREENAPEGVSIYRCGSPAGLRWSDEPVSRPGRARSRNDIHDQETAPPWSPKPRRGRPMRSGILASIIVLLASGNALAQEHPEHPQQTEPAAKVITATITGQNFCVGCELKATLGAAAQCDVYGHQHALKVTSVSANGEEMPEMKGWVLHYLASDKGDPFIKGHHNETLTLTGKIYLEPRVLEVEKQVRGKDRASGAIPDRR